jgi:hypothetical protein
VLTGIRIPRMNAIMERWIQTSRCNAYRQPPPRSSRPAQSQGCRSAPVTAEARPTASSTRDTRLSRCLKNIHLNDTTCGIEHHPLSSTSSGWPG